MTTVTIFRESGQNFTGYLAKPASGTGPGVLVIQEIFGVNAGMRAICDQLAADGYFAFCPDIFWRQEANVDLSDKTDAEWQKAFALYNGFNVDQGIRDLQAALRVLRVMPGCTGKVGTMGFCLGGKLAYLMATRSDANCSVSYYGGGIDALLDETPNIKAPLLMHLAERDEYMQAPARQAIRNATAPLPHVTTHSYDADHAFARVNGVHTDPVAAKLANDRTAAFLKQHLA
jgi:carboxymethylenebutenolidase